MRDLHELPKLRDGLSYLYVEHGIVERKDSAIEVIDKNGRTMVPAAALAVLMLGPGTTITHAAVQVAGRQRLPGDLVRRRGSALLRPGLAARRARAYHLLRQAELAAIPASRMEVVLRMYRYRFGDELDARASAWSRSAGSRACGCARPMPRPAGPMACPWHGRVTIAPNWKAGDPVNRALSAANACLNGLCHAAIVSGGYSPGLGFVHTGQAALLRLRHRRPLQGRDHHPARLPDGGGGERSSWRHGCAGVPSRAFREHGCWIASCPTSNRCWASRPEVDAARAESRRATRPAEPRLVGRQSWQA